MPRAVELGLDTFGDVTIDGDGRPRSQAQALLKYSNGTLAHDALMTSIELFGTKVAPRVRELLA